MKTKLDKLNKDILIENHIHYGKIAIFNKRLKEIQSKCQHDWHLGRIIHDSCKICNAKRPII